MVLVVAMLLLLHPAEPVAVSLLLLPMALATVCVLLLPFFSQAVASARHLGQARPTIVYAQHLSRMSVAFVAATLLRLLAPEEPVLVLLLL